MIIDSDEFLNRLRKLNRYRDWNYLERVIQNAWNNEGAKTDLKEYLELFDPADHTRESKTMNGLYKWPGLVYFFELADAKKPLSDDSLMDNFLYDRGTGIVILNIIMGHHESLMVELYSAYTGKELKYDRQAREQFAERYVSDGHGMCKSSVGNRVLKSASMKLSAQEKEVFSKFILIDIEGS